ncbi:hypothetical protein [Methylotenera sp. G11]|nr:hypothetical protein [Methylotenera sp. G11]
MEQSSNLEIRFKTQAALISDEELALIESVMPELILVMMQNHQADD